MEQRKLVYGTLEIKWQVIGFLDRLEGRCMLWINITVGNGWTVVCRFCDL